MKIKFRILSALTAAVLLAAGCLTAYAAPSPGGTVIKEDNPYHMKIAGDRIVKTTIEGTGIIKLDIVKEADDLKYKLIVTPYAQYPTIADPTNRDLCPVVYQDIVPVPVLSDYLPIIRPKAAAISVPPEDCCTYQIFDVTYYRDYGDHLEKSDKHSTISLNLPDYVLDRFVCLLHYMNGQWYVVDNAYVERSEGLLCFSVDKLSPFAIIVHENLKTDTTIKSPQTGYGFFEEMYLTVKEWLTDLFERG